MRGLQTDREFVQFVSMPWGYRAAFCLLRTYRTKYGACTIREIISRWAPDVENHTSAYISAVCRWTCMGPDERLTSETDRRYIRVVAAMSRLENGMHPNMLEVRRGWEMYLG